MQQIKLLIVMDLASTLWSCQARPLPIRVLWLGSSLVPGLPRASCPGFDRPCCQGKCSTFHPAGFMYLSRKLASQSPFSLSLQICSCFLFFSAKVCPSFATSHPVCPSAFYLCFSACVRIGHRAGLISGFVILIQPQRLMSRRSLWAISLLETTILDSSLKY